MEKTKSKVDGYIIVVSIISVTVLEIVALLTGHDGTYLLAVVGAISALAGLSGGYLAWSKSS